MSPKGTKGKRSVWQTMDRCLDIVIRLMEGPARSEELLQIVEDRVRDDGGINDLKGVFEEDRGRIRAWLCDISHDRSSDEYMLGELKRPLLNLPDEAVRGLAFLQQSFGPRNAPMRSEVNALIDSMMRVLPYKRRRDIQNERGLLELELGVRDDDFIPDEIWSIVEEACTQSRLLQLRYGANREDGGTVIHKVEPLRHFFDASHFYLEAFCLETWGPGGHFEFNKVFTYRLGRIQEAVLLPEHFLRGGRRIPKSELVYELTPEVARLGVTKHFPESVIVQQPNGGAVVHVMSVNLFFDVRRLLRYGRHCRVVGGEDAVNEMKKIVREMYKVYEP